jgi:hypothetical protein
VDPVVVPLRVPPLLLPVLLLEPVPLLLPLVPPSVLNELLLLELLHAAANERPTARTETGCALFMPRGAKATAMP